MDWIDALQWPAMAVTVGATWLVGSTVARRRTAGFWIFLLSNALWVVWGLSTDAYALIVLQFALAVLNVRGMFKARQLRKEGEGREGEGREGGTDAS